MHELILTNERIYCVSSTWVFELESMRSENNGREVEPVHNFREHSSSYFNFVLKQ